MISRFTRRQLVAFLIVSILGVGVMAGQYIQLPQQLGWGRYELGVELSGSGGLYPKAAVTYRGHEVGTVRSLSLREGGVVAYLSIDDDVTIPRKVSVEVRSASAIGEQYVDFVPSRGADTAATWGEGDIVPAEQATVPVTTANLLESVNATLQSVPQDSLRTTVDEAGAAFSGRGDDLGRLLDSGMELQTAADDDLAATTGLLESLQQVLGTQQEVEGQIRSYAGDLDQVSGTVAEHDKELSGVITHGAPAAQQVDALAGDLRLPLPQLLTDLSLTAPVLKTYLPGIRHLLIVLPGAIEAHYSNGPADRLDDELPEANLSFKTGVNSPPVCTTGFADAGKHRSPKDTSPAPLRDGYCKVPHDDQRVVRGARNNPCPNDPNRYAATAAGCGLVFQRRAEPVEGEGAASYDPESGQLLAPSGDFFLVDDLAAGLVPASWQELLTQLAGAP